MSAASKIAARKRDAEALGSAVEYLPVVRRVVQRFARRLPSHVDIDDLMGAGVVGLLEAMERFDPARATEFTAYAEFRIKGAVIDDLRRRDLMARDARSEAKQLEHTLAQLTQTLGRVPEEDELAAHLQLDLTTLQSKLEKLTPVRLTSFDELSGLAPSTHDNPFEHTARHEMADKLAQAIGQLTKRQQQVLHLYYREDLTLREIGQVLSVTESRVCQILAAATLQLRALLQDRPLQGDSHG